MVRFKFHKKRLRPIFTILYICGSIYLKAQPVTDTLQMAATETILNDDPSIHESVNNKFIKTVQLNRIDLELGYPMILLSSTDKLELSFDDLRANVTNYTYTFVHCNKNWEPSGLTTFDYIDGFEENPINDYKFSFATAQHYTHYAVQFPNEDINLKLSGNYLIYIWESDDKTQPVIVRRFFVWEDKAVVKPTVARPNLVAYRNEFQEINFTVDIKNVSVSNPYDEIRVVVMQNGRFDNAYENLKPRLISNDLITYDQDDIVFPAGKEFRRFDLKTLRFQSDRIRKLEKIDAQIHAYINIDESRSFGQYYYEKDLNGQYVIEAENVNDVSTEGDYALVHFTLQYPYFITSGKFYVFGEFNNFQLNSENEMIYDFDRMQYTASLYLKQGYYNYMYAFQQLESGKTDFTYAEGNNYETENDYLVFVYQHIYDRDYDELIGISVFNSLRK